MPGFSSRGIFLSYRREDAAPYARLLKFQLAVRFPDAQVFMDLDSIEAGLDFAEVIREAVDSCAVLVALIGRQWAALADEQGHRRLDNPDDLVRFEIQTALEHGVRVIPVLVDGARPLGREQLPPELQKLARLNALELSYGRYDYDADRLIDVIQRVLAAVRDLEEADRKAEEEADRKAPEEADRKAPEEADRKAPEEADRKAPEEADRKAPEEADRKAPEGANRRGQKHIINGTSASVSREHQNLIRRTESHYANEPVTIFAVQLKGPRVLRQRALIVFRPMSVLIAIAGEPVLILPYEAIRSSGIHRSLLISWGVDLRVKTADETRELKIVEMDRDPCEKLIALLEQ